MDGGSSTAAVLALLRSLAQPDCALALQGMFPAKWRAIHEKLQQLTDGLGLCIDDPAAPELAASLLPTLREVEDVFRRCGGVGCGGGKLLIRSDLGVIGSKLDMHLIGIAKAQSGRAIVPVRPDVGAGVDNVRLYIGSLFSRLEVADAAIKIESLSLLRELVDGDDDNCARIIALESGDAVGLLLSFLESKNACAIQEEAAGVVGEIAKFTSCRGVLARAGAIAALLHVLEKGTTEGRVSAARALTRLTANSDNAWCVSAHGGVPVLLAACGDTDSSSELILSVCSVLKNLIGVEEILRFMVDQGAVTVFMALSQHEHEACKIEALRLLHLMAAADATVRDTAVSDGLVESIARALRPEPPQSTKVRETALAALPAICTYSKSLLSAVAEQGLLESLRFFVDSGEAGLQEHALRAVLCMSRLPPEFKKMIGKAGLMADIAGFSVAKSCVMREMAAEALSVLLSERANRRAFLQDDGNLDNLMLMLDAADEKPAMTTAFVLAALQLLTQGSRTASKKIQASKLFVHLKNLAESGVLDAKKIMKNVTHTKLRNAVIKILKI